MEQDAPVEPDPADAPLPAPDAGLPPAPGAEAPPAPGALPPPPAPDAGATPQPIDVAQDPEVEEVGKDEEDKEELEITDLDAPIDGGDFVQEKALKFCKQQEVVKVMNKAQKIVDGGEFENYDTIEEMFRGALQVGEKDTSTMSVFSDLDQVLDDDYRHPIPMGIPGIDRLLKGGLAKGEIGVVLAPTGVGVEEQKEERQRQRVKELMEKRKQKEQNN
ncbi:unnamed protein product [Notodromas monacha]|uniref:Uncharacterized protein n=1 Tax=Notodromas monacha TaxID=399045 RepID=A0A7R9BDK1_9CRUS|nr:unnamed protein product [Notodromas monacha]CAG0912524.1 unnamed protein product [Notodromas monacha]